MNTNLTRQQYVKQRKRKIKDNVKKKVIRRDGRCLECGSKENLTIDHIVPISKGGDNNMKNLMTLCHVCNQKKGRKLNQKYILMGIDAIYQQDNN